MDSGDKELSKRDASTVVAKTLGNCVVLMYEVWKQRCERVLEVALPTRQRNLMDEITGMTRDKGMVEARDRFLFQEEHLPKETDTVQVMKDWITSVRLSAERYRRKHLRAVFESDSADSDYEEENTVQEEDHQLTGNF